MIANNRRDKLPSILREVDIEKLRGVLVIENPMGARNRAIFEVMLGSGLRVSELLNLQPEDIRWESAVLEVHAGKGGKDRNVPVTDETIRWLRVWEVWRPASGLTFFCSFSGGRISVRSVQVMIKNLAYKAKMANHRVVHPHTFRHTYATAMLRRGLSLRDVQYLLGHSSVMTTQIYTFVDPCEVANKIRAFNPPAEPVVIKPPSLPPNLQEFSMFDPEVQRQIIDEAKKAQAKVEAERVEKERVSIQAKIDYAKSPEGWAAIQELERKANLPRVPWEWR